jgi:stage II sporulation protein AB (anti-sigma F factor)
MIKRNNVSLDFLAISENEALARNVAGFFAVQFSPTISEVSDIKTAVSEAVTNSIVHGYPNKKGIITMELVRLDDVLHINVIDRGIGISNISKALEPFYTTKEEDERSGMGFTIMKSFMDDVKVESEVGLGVKVSMTKKLRAEPVE